jgi:hypothetical protein
VVKFHKQHQAGFAHAFRDQLFQLREPAGQFLFFREFGQIEPADGGFE